MLGWWRGGGPMRSLFARPLGRLVELLGSGGRRWRVLAPCLVLCVAGGMASAGDAGGRQYSAYSDTKKPVLSFLLSEKENVRDFRETFGLDDRETEEALSIVRAENERLAGEYAESEKLVAANRSLPAEETSRKIAAPDHDETVASAVEETKDEIAALLPEAERDRLAAWVDEGWGAGGAEAAHVDGGRAVAAEA